MFIHPRDKAFSEQHPISTEAEVDPINLEKEDAVNGSHLSPQKASQASEQRMRWLSPHAHFSTTPVTPIYQCRWTDTQHRPAACPFFHPAVDGRPEILCPT